MPAASNGAGARKGRAVLVAVAVAAVLVLVAVVGIWSRLAGGLRGPTLQPVAVTSVLTPVAGGTLVRVTLSSTGDLPSPLRVDLTRLDTGQIDDGTQQPTGRTLAITAVTGTGVRSEFRAGTVTVTGLTGTPVSFSYTVGAVDGRRVVFPAPRVDGARVSSLVVRGPVAACTVAGGGADPPGQAHYSAARLGSDGRVTGTDGRTYPTRCELAPVPATAPASGASGSAMNPSGFRPVLGTALRFALPTSPAFVGDAQQVGPQGALERRWRYKPVTGGGNCVVLTVEQPAFTGDFPQSTMQLFAARSLPGQQNLRNDPITPAPARTAAGLSQEATYSAQLGDGTSVPARIIQLTYLTPGRTLISISVTGPETLLDECRLREIAASFAATGREFTAPPATSPTRPAASA